MEDYSRLEKFIRENYAAVCAVAAQFVDKDTAQDIAQNVLSRFWENREKYKDVCLRPSELPVIADIIMKADTYEDINLMYQYVRYSERLLGALERMKRVVSAGENQLMKLNDIQCRDGCISIKMHRMY